MPKQRKKCFQGTYPLTLKLQCHFVNYQNFTPLVESGPTLKVTMININEKLLDC